MAPEDFIQKYGKAVIRATRGTGLFPSVKMAQMAIESGWGRSMPGNNAFGIKAAGKETPFWKGDYTSQGTREEVNGQLIGITSKFRSYPSVQDSIMDHSAFLAQYGRYKPVFLATTAGDQAVAMGRSGYATDSGYGQKLLNMISKYDLQRLDRQQSGQWITRVVVAVVVIAIVAFVIYRMVRRKRK